VAINGGFTQADCASLRRVAVDLDADMIDFNE
jgi:hypothetical protein